ncbi:RDD family protein [Pedobacter yonginense]|nr:RDD family protein [Pedobacter yonginense]
MNLTSAPYQEIDYRYCRASASLRFVNHVIDTIYIYALIFCLGFVIALIDPTLIDAIDDGITDRVIGILFYGVMMAFTEFMLNGKSFGKLITKTKAVNIDGSDLSFQKTFTRNLLRMIPLDAIVALGIPSTPLHDRFSDTMVVDERKLALQKQRVDLFGSFKNQTQ